MEYFFNPETWKQQWAAFLSAPLIMAPSIVFVAWGAWWFRGLITRERMAVLEERLKFADQIKAGPPDVANLIDGGEY